MGAVFSCLYPRKNKTPKVGDDQPLQPIVRTVDEADNQDRSPNLKNDTGARGETEVLHSATSKLEEGENKVSKRSPAVRTAAEGLKLALTVAEKALDGLPIPGAKGAIGIVLSLIAVAEKASSNPQTLRQLRAHVEFLSTNALEPLQTLSEDDIPDGMKDDVNRLVSALEQVGSIWEERAKRGSVRRWVEATADEEDLKAFADDIKQAVEQFKFTIAIRGRLSDRRQEKQLETIYSTQKTNHDNDVFRDRARLVLGLPRAENAHYNTGKLGGHSTCFEGTRIEVINTITSWLETKDEPSGPRLFWLNGLAGIGKSTIAKTIAVDADLKGILAGSFFFSRGDEKLTDPTLVFPTLAFQLANVDMSLKSSIGQALESDASYAHAGMQIQLQKLIVEPLLANFSSMNRKRLVFVLDALDECRDDARSADIVRLLLSHLRLIPFVRVLLTSRPEFHIQQSFSGAADHNEFILHDIEKNVVQEDIRLYLRKSLNTISTTVRVLSAIEPQEPSWPRETDIETLVQMSGTLFVYAATSVRFIGTRNPVRQMQILLGVQQASGTKPYAQLDGLYIQILRNGLPLDGDDAAADEEVDIFQRVIGTLVLLRDPLSLRALSAFTEVPSADVMSTFNYLRSVVIMPPSPDEPLQIYHPSFRDFLTIPKRCSEPRYAIELPSTEKRLTLRCLNLLVDDRRLRRDVLNLGEGSHALLNENINNLEGLLHSAFPPEVHYALLYWHSHLSQVEPDDQDVVSLLYKFASRYLLFWFEAMSLLKQTSRAIAAMREAHLWVVKASHQQLKTLLYDGYRFALSHQATIEAGALQVYHSALPFTPHNTLLYKTYALEEAKSMHVLRGVPAEWSPCLASLGGGHGGITSVAYSHDGTLFALGFGSEFITMQAASSGELLSSFEYPTPQEILSLAFLPGDEYLVAGTTSGTIAQWSVLTASIVRSYIGHTVSTTCVAVCVKAPNVMASASKDATIRLWDVSTGKCTDVLSCHDSPVHAVAFTPEGARLLSGSEDGIVRMWDVSTRSEVRAVSAHKSGITSLAISPDGQTYCTGSVNHVVKIFAMDVDVPTFRLTDHAKKITWLAYAVNGATLLSAGQDERHARLWDTSNGALIGLTRGYVTQAAFSPNGEQLVTASTDGIFRIWAAKDASPTIDPIDHSDWVISVKFSPDGKLLATGGNENDKTVKIWDVIAGTHIHTLHGHGWSIYALAFSDDGSMLASGSGDATVRVWDVSSGNLLLELPRHDNYILQLQFTEGGLHLISRTPTATYTWDISVLAASGEEAVVGVLLNEQPEHNEEAKGYMSGDSQGYCFSMGDAHRVFMGKGGWDRAGLVGAVQEEYRITGFAFHSDRVVFACTDGSIVILDVSRLKPGLESNDESDE